MDNELDRGMSIDTILEYGRIFMRWSWLLILAALVGGGIAYYRSSQQTPVYQTSTLVMVKSGTINQYDYYSSIYYGQQLIDTYAKVLTTRSVLDELSNLLGFNVGAGMFSVKPIEGTQLMTITVTDTNPSRAALIANTIVGIFTRQIQADQSAYYVDAKKNIEDQITAKDGDIQNLTNELIALGDDPQYDVRREQLQMTLSNYQQVFLSLQQSLQQMRQFEIQNTFNIIQKDPAPVPTSPVSPQPMRSAIIGAMIGFLIGAAVVVLIEFLNDSIRDPQEITRKYGIPIMGTIASFDSSESPLITIKQPRSPVSEAFRALRTNLQFFSIDRPLRTILVTSTSPSDGKTTVAVNLASVIAQSNQSAIIVDADLRRPRVHQLLQVPNRVGLTDQFIHEEDFYASAIKPSGIKDLSVLTSGNLPPNPSELLSTEKMVEIIDQLKIRFKTVIIDTTPILAVSDATILAPRVDGVLLVIKPSITKRSDFGHAIEQLKKVNANLLGIVVNDVKLKKTSYYYRNYYTGSEYEASKEFTGEENPLQNIVKPTDIQDETV